MTLCHWNDVLTGIFSTKFVTGYRGSERDRFYNFGGKRSLDIVLAAFTAPVWIPLLAVLIILTTVLTGSPIYMQKRVGRNGREFRIVKIRTMVKDADARLQHHLLSDPDAQAEWTLHQKFVSDPRVTAFGRMLRKTSMDELPQILNVLMGHMSIVGPRPMVPEQKILYPGNNYYNMRPGITGLWQIMERNRSTFAAREIYDSKYYMAMSLRTDLWIILRTFRVVFSCNGR